VLIETGDRKDIMSLNARVTRTEEVLNKKDENKVKTDSKLPFLNCKQWQQKRYEEAEPWMKIPPTDMREKKFEGGYEYMWCPYHKMWVQHRPSECRLNPNNRGDRNMAYRSGKPRAYNQENCQRDGQYNNNRRDDRNQRDDRNRRPGRSGNNHHDPRRNEKQHKNSRRRIALQAANDDSYTSEDTYDSQDDSVVPDYDYSDEYDK
jgi:hypothetical protein